MKIIGLMRPDEETWFAFRNIWDLCRENTVKIPDEVREYFGPDGPTRS